MPNTYKIIDEENWERRMHCAVFRNSVEPAFCVTFEADVTNFLEKVKKQNLSFTLSMVYAVCKCANEIEELRYRFIDGKIVLFDKIDTAFTYSGKKDNATPLFDWGKYYEKDGRIVMPVSVQAHHSFVDGIHIGQFAEKLQEYLNEQ